MKAVVEEGLYRGYQVGRQDGVIIFVLIIFIFDVVVKADEAIEKVNLWVKKETRGLIKNILSPGSIDRFTSVVLANALYFKGAWDEPLDASKTRDYDFHLLNDKSVMVPFVTSEEKQFVRAFDGFKVLRLPYQRGIDKRQFSMYIFLPDEKDGLSALIETVASESEFLEHKLPFKKVELGEFRIPSFKISFGVETSDMLKELGVVLPFSGGLTKMVDSLEGENLFASKIFQKSFIEVNEEGTEAAAATAFIGIGYSFDDTPKIDFLADHPFLFLIREDISGTILFAGQVLNPLDGQS